ncbi:hypothetical protein [Methylobacterium sp. 10]|uniref:hypothetical protein n=1 Tax=Methylobacterium sp. 10 TaxID=1101191 RepID=UPI000484A1DC|nr:hypothetical protein [Methylobacterium sp. 10]
MTAHLILGAALGLTLSGAAFAQSYTAPAGIPAATAPGGLDGLAAARNIGEYDSRFSRPVRARIDAGGAVTTGSVRQTPPRHRY